MNNFLEYKGYHTKIQYDADDSVLRGKIEGINDLVDFECSDMKSVEKEFHAAVDDYLDFCKEVGKEPEKEYKGTFNVRISPELHKKLAIISLKNGDSLNASVEKAIKDYVSDDYISGKDLRNAGIILSDSLKTESTYSYVENNKQYGENVIPFNKIKFDFREEM
ncbi:MAG: type II toxin-antitoxin system HicB family antitoxin [Lachnospiraceae bacterium]|nr:type II toxin-antitoxin system HicB family antitoxin [Lachnospiraceae bacterium]